MPYEARPDFKFFPRPEAHPMNWEQLLPPVQDAVNDLLFRIKGATDEGVKEERTANCFLVYGDRGTGKTTVLLSAKSACDPKPKKPFFPEEYGDSDDKKKAAKKSAEGLKGNVIWLDVLDLEPLPPETNLLTTVLTWVRNALNPAGDENLPTEATSIFEESAESARHKLNQLINDATLMWEDIREPDTRSRANRQVAAANIYAQFPERFRKAMDTLSGELARRRSGTTENPRKLILPIDNIDRSTDHLYNIVKLAQMVSSPYLWLVMAGDRQDVDTFLERAFWKELIRIGGGAGAIGKTSLAGEDEALVMARRQAAATSHKLLPPSHRVEVQLVKPEETLRFSLPTKDTAKTIRQLLSEISVREGGGYLPEIRLIDLFDASEHIQNVLKNKYKTGEEHLTRVAQLGLCLPARGVLDLWQLADGIVNNDNVTGTRKAEWIARVMLRNVIAESTMPSETGRRLQEQILKHTSSGGTMLDFWDPTRNFDSILEVLPLRSLDFELCLGQEDLVFQELKPEGGKDESSKKEGTVPVDFNLSVIITKALNLRLKHSPQGDTRISDEMLPDLVAAWIMVLHDVVILGAEDSTVISTPRIGNPVIVECRHFSNYGAITEKYWPLPSWEIFFARDIYEQLWRDFRSILINKTCGANLLDQAGQEGEASRLLVAGCVACALETFFIFSLPRKSNSPSMLSSLEKKFPYGEMQCKPEEMKEIIQKTELNVIKRAANLYESILGVNKSKGTVFHNNERMMGMRSWLELDLPFLLSYFYVPISGGNGKTRAEEIIDFLEGTELAKVWANPRGLTRVADIVWRKEQEFEARRLYPPETTPVKVGKLEDPKIATAEP